MTLQEFSDWLGIVGWFVTGVWIFKDHLKKRADFPRINLHASMREIAKSGDGRVVEVAAEVENTGDVRHVFRSVKYDVRGSDMHGLKGSQKALGQVNLPMSIVRGRRFFPKSWEYSFVDAGQKSTYKHLILVPAKVKIAQLRVIMSYDDEESDFHSAVCNVMLQD